MNCKLIDSRGDKTYTGKLLTDIVIGKPIKVLFPDGKHEFFVSNIKRALRVDSRIYIIDAHGIRFTLILQ